MVVLCWLHLTYFSICYIWIYISGRFKWIIIWFFYMKKMHWRDECVKLQHKERAVERWSVYYINECFIWGMTDTNNLIMCNIDIPFQYPEYKCIFYVGKDLLLIVWCNNKRHSVSNHFWIQFPKTIYFLVQIR